MSGFDAGGAVSALEFNFTTAKGADGNPCKGKGVVPEPSQDLIDEVFEDLRGLMASVGLKSESVGGDATVEVVKTLTEAPEGVMKSISSGMLDTVAKLTQGQPSREEIAALSSRHRQAFYGWLLGHFGDPQRSKDATRP